MSTSSPRGRVLQEGKHQSAWDVINITISGLAQLIYQLSLYEQVGKTALLDPAEVDDAISAEVITQVSGWLTIATGVADNFEASSAKKRITNFNKELKRGMSWRMLGFQCKVLREAFTEDLKDQLIYRYFDDKAKIFSKWKEDWSRITEKFPSVSEDAKASVDCWALGYATASVFHSMRILEFGLAALAHNIGREVGTHNWQNIIDQIESAIRELGKTLPAGRDKVDRLQFLSEAAKELAYFKDGWRNHVSHNRATYDEHQARSVMEHVRSFMDVLSKQLSEVQLPS
jgi:hypothetical protein